jgi:hypothetical protein
LKIPNADPNRINFQGVKKFSVGLSNKANLGTWSIHVNCGENSWSGAVNVSSQDGNSGFKDSEAIGTGSGSRSAAAEEHYVELRFAPTTKRWYKPGLSFKGKVSLDRSDYVKCQ